ncbi:MAG TPA: ABC transporter permease [Microbacteriaceae bacterium]|nr:ABC transporter permease [Microbacteriaceae bacterium]
MSTAKIELESTTLVSWKSAIAFIVITVVSAALLLGAPNPGEVTYKLSQSDDNFQLAPLELTGAVVTVVTLVVLALLSVAAVLLTRAQRRVPIWVAALFGAVAFFGFLTWAAAGSTTPVVPLPGLLAGGVSLAVPLIFGAMTGVIGERSGVVNIAIEGQLLAGAFTSAMVATLTHNPWAGLIAAMVAGVLVSLLLSLFAIRYWVEQVIVGVVLNVLVIGLTNFLFSEVMASNAATLNQPPRFDRLPIPFLADIPLIGPMFFRQTVIVYVMYITVAVVAFTLAKTRWGLRTRAVGEHPTAADTVGIRVNRLRFINILIAGAIAGFGGAFFTLGAVGAFNKEMTAGAGYIALAAVIFGQWDPIKATLAALLFGFASNIQNTLGVMGSPVPSQFMLMLPYLATIFAVAGLVGRSRPPAADGIPYKKA